ncbi:unnamed protein product [Malus baccata var. baccata]
MEFNFSQWRLKLFVVATLFQVSFGLSRLFQASLATRELSESIQNQTQLLKYHNDPLLSGKITINLIWYVNFNSRKPLFPISFPHSYSRPNILPRQIPDYQTDYGISDQKNAIIILLTSTDVAVDEFCMNRCMTHESASDSTKLGHVKGNKNYKFAYIWVQNARTQYPGQCTWPFHQPIYRPQSHPLWLPTMTLLAGIATNPFRNGYFQDPAEASLETASACPEVYKKRAYPGYVGYLLQDATMGANYNANGANGRKYLIPALYNPTTSSCSSLV